MAASSSQADLSTCSAYGETSVPNQAAFVIEELSDNYASSAEELWQEEPSQPVPTTSKSVPSLLIPDIFTSNPPIRDLLNTETSIRQDETVEECLPFLTATSGEFTVYNDHGVPHLNRARHIGFLHKILRGFPSKYVAADAARPWFFYWALCALRTLGEDVASYRERLISTVRPMQNATGGFGGGHRQMSHLAPTYAIVLALALVGGEEALEFIDRKAMWRWLGAMKQPDGGFQMSVGGEEDVRGAYCAAVLISLLNLPLELPPDSPAKSHETDTLLTGTPEYIGRCQTFEGGISARPDGEAHGAFTFCALACLCIMGDPRVIIPENLDIPSLMSWLSARQYAPEGGFAGRTNKLVDGCYSHWIGGCWPLVAAALNPPAAPEADVRGWDGNNPNTESKGKGKALYSRDGLTRYILCVCQETSRRGGMRDKPSKKSDGYHTCYVLAGLSSVQHTWLYTPSTVPIKLNLTGNLAFPYNWSAEKFVDETGEEVVFDEIDRVVTLHPVFVVPEGVAERTRGYFVEKGGF